MILTTKGDMDVETAVNTRLTLDTECSFILFFYYYYLFNDCTGSCSVFDIQGIWLEMWNPRLNQTKPKRSILRFFEMGLKTIVPQFVSTHQHHSLTTLRVLLQYSEVLLNYWSWECQIKQYVALEKSRRPTVDVMCLIVSNELLDYVDILPQSFFFCRSLG